MCGLELLFKNGAGGFLVGELERGGKRIVEGFLEWEELVAHASGLDENDGSCATETGNFGFELNTD